MTTPPCRGDVPFAAACAVHAHVRIPLWDERLSTAFLENKRAVMGARDFARGYQQRAYADTDLLWSEATLEAAKDPHYTVVDAVGPESRFAKWPRYAGVDLTISTDSQAAAFFVVLIFALDPADGTRWILHCHRHRHVEWGQQVRLLEELHEAYQFAAIKCESNQAQKWIVQHLHAALPITGIYTGAAQKRDVEIGIPSLAVEWEHQRWRVPYGDARSQRVMEPLLTELAAYPAGAFDDTVMACFFARECVRHQVKAEPDIVIFRM